MPRHICPGTVVFFSSRIALPNDSPWPDPFLDAVFDSSVGQRTWEREAPQLELDRRYGSVLVYPAGANKRWYPVWLDRRANQMR